MTSRYRAGPTRLAAIEQGLRRADKLKPNTGYIESGIAVDTRSLFGFVDTAGRVGENLSLFGQGRVSMPWSDPMSVEASVIGGLRYTW